MLVLRYAGHLCMLNSMLGVRLGLILGRAMREDNRREEIEYVLQV